MLAAHKLSVLFARFLIIAWYFWHSHSPARGFTELFRCTGSAPLPATSLRPTWTHFARFITHWAGRPRISCILFRNSGRAKDFEVNCYTKKRCMLTYSAPVDKSFSGAIGKGRREGNLLSCGWPWRLWLVLSGTRRRRGALPFFKESPTIVKIWQNWGFCSYHCHIKGLHHNTKLMEARINLLFPKQ